MSNHQILVPSNTGYNNLTLRIYHWEFESMTNTFYSILNAENFVIAEAFSFVNETRRFKFGPKL